ncbi:MAG: VOC family protein [Candidatus Nitrosomaritimum yanchengensis]
MVKPIPDGFHSITPAIVVNNAKEAIEFYKKAFNAKEIYTFPTPDGKILHSMFQIGDSRVMMSDEFPSMGIKSPTTVGGTSVTLHLYVEEADKIFKQAVNAGAIITMPIMHAFWGDRYGIVMDPYGHMWAIATHKIDMTPEGLRKAGEEYFASLKK